MQIIELYIKGYKRYNGSGNSLTSNQLIDTTATFTETATIGDVITNLNTNEIARITAVVSNTELTLSDTIFVASQPAQEYQLTSDYFRADLFKDESITITDTLLNVKDISKVFTPFSQQFNLPASKTNNKLFRHYENQDILDSFDARFRHDAIIKLNGVDFKKGKIQFKSVSLKNNKAHAYKVVFFGDTVDLKEILGETKLSGLIYDDNLNFDYNFNNIYDRFTDTEAQLELDYGTSDIIVPNIHHSKNMRLTNDGYKDYITNTELSWTDLKPAIRCKAIIKAITNTFPQLQFTNGFFDDIRFYNIFMWLHKNEGFITNAEEGGDTFIVRNRWRHQDDDPLDYTHTSTTPSSYGDVRTQNILYPGWQHKFLVKVYISTGTTEPYTVRILKGSTETPYYEHTYENGGPSTTTAEINYNITPGGPLDVIIEIESNNTISMTQTLGIERYIVPFPGLPQFQWSNVYTANYSPTNTNIDNTFYVAKQMPDMKVIDFLSALFKMFNLVVFKRRDNSISVQLANWYMNIGNNWDITKYVDMESSSVERLFQYKEMQFKFKSKKSFLVQFADEINQEPFAEEDFGDNQWDGGVYKVELSFEKMMYERLNNEDTNTLSYIGQGAMLNKKFEPTIGQPLLFADRLQPNTNNELTIDEIVPNNYRRPTQLVQYWGNKELALNFGIDFDEWEQQVPDDTTNLFESSYLDYVESVFDPKARLLKVTAYLPVSILLQYKLNDKFIINNKVYRINSVKTNLLTNKSQLELYNKDEFISQLRNSQVAYLGRVPQVSSSDVFKSRFTINFDGISGTNGYELYVNDELKDSTTGGTGSKSLTATGLIANTSYTAAIRAKYDVDGNDLYSFDTGINVETNNVTPP